jgi:hypothetical protein
MQEKKEKIYGKTIEKKISEEKDNAAYRVCLQKTANAKAIEAAYKKNDFCAIEAVMKKCGVPDDKMRHVMIEILDCKDNKPEIWI